MTDRSEKGRVLRVAHDGRTLLTKEPMAAIHGVPTEWAGRDCYVAPLREGEPRPGEMWRDSVTDEDVEILSAPFGDGYVIVRPLGDKMFTVDGMSWQRVSHLTPLPKKKRYRVGPDLAVDWFEIEAESAEAARASLSVEEVGDAD